MHATRGSLLDGNGGDGTTERAPPSSGRRAMRSVSGTDAQGTASPVVVARQSMLDADAANGDGSGANGAGQRRTARQSMGLGPLAEDELGAVTPVGLARGASGSEANGTGGARQSVVGGADEAVVG